jgi:hypothetical protein
MKADAIGIGFHFFFEKVFFFIFHYIWLNPLAMLRLYNTLHGRWNEQWKYYLRVKEQDGCQKSWLLMLAAHH